MADQKKIKKNMDLLEGNALDIARELISYLVSDRDYTKEQGQFVLEPSMLPDEMTFERAVLRVIYSFSAEPDEKKRPKPTQDNVLARLVLDFPDAKERMMRLLSHRKPERRITMLAMNLGEFIQRRKMIDALESSLKIARSEIGLGNVPLYEQITENLSAVAPQLHTIESSLWTDLHIRESIEHKRLYEMDKRGIAAGPTFPWENLRKIVPFIEAGDLWTIIAETKHGKSQIAQMISEWMAWEIGGYNVGFYHLETSGRVFWRRYMGRNLPIHANDIKHVDIENDPRTRDRFRELAAKRLRDEKERGELWYSYSPGITWGQFQQRVLKDKARSDAIGRKLVVVLDYYQKFDWSGFGINETAGYNALAAKLKDFIAELGIYGITFAQDHIGDTTKDKKNTPTVYGGNKIAQVSQGVIRVIRKQEAMSDKLWTDAEGRPQRDILGRPMLLHKAGELDSSAIFHVVRANDNPSGSAQVAYVGPYFNIVDADVETVNFD